MKQHTIQNYPIVFGHRKFERHCPKSREISLLYDWLELNIVFLRYNVKRKSNVPDVVLVSVQYREVSVVSNFALDPFIKDASPRSKVGLRDIDNVKPANIIFVTWSMTLNSRNRCFQSLLINFVYVVKLVEKRLAFWCRELAFAI